MKMLFNMSTLAAITDASRFWNCPTANQSNPPDVNMFVYDIFNMNNIAKNMNSLSSPDPISVASTFYKNESTVVQQFT